MDALPPCVLSELLHRLPLEDTARTAWTCRALWAAARGDLFREAEARDALRRGFAPALDLDASGARAACAACGLPGHRPYAELFGRCTDAPPLALVGPKNAFHRPLDGVFRRPLDDPCLYGYKSIAVREERVAMLRPAAAVRVSATFDPGVSVRFVGIARPADVRPSSGQHAPGLGFGRGARIALPPGSVEWHLRRAGPVPCACPDRACVWTLVVDGAVPEAVQSDGAQRVCAHIAAHGLRVTSWRLGHKRSCVALARHMPSG